MISGKTREETCSAVLRTRDRLASSYSYTFGGFQQRKECHLLSCFGQSSSTIKFGGCHHTFGTPPTYYYCALVFESIPYLPFYFASSFGRCKVQGVHVHDDHYLLNSVEVSLKTARSRIVHTSIDHGRDEQRPIKENTKKFVGTCFI